MKPDAWSQLNDRIVGCERCPRLREYCRDVAREKRRAFLEWDYWGRPVPNFGAPDARLLIIGLAPAAHGANRTGRMFTGDRSGDFLFRALCKAGFANQAHATARNDGLSLIDCAITATAHCAPPGNQPAPEEIAACQTWLIETIDLLPVRAIVALGQIGWKAAIQEARRRGWWQAPMPKFGHGAQVQLEGNRSLIGSYHPSQQNTFTGRLTEKMFDDVFASARRAIESPRGR